MDELRVMGGAPPPAETCVTCFLGQRVKHFCTKTTDTVCADCEDSTYTQLWNWVSKCLGCGSRCSSSEWPKERWHSGIPLATMHSSPLACKLTRITPGLLF